MAKILTDIINSFNFGLEQIKNPYHFTGLIRGYFDSFLSLFDDSETEFDELD